MYAWSVVAAIAVAALMIGAIHTGSVSSDTQKLTHPPYPTASLGALAIYDPVDKYIVMWYAQTWTYSNGSWAILSTATQPPGWSNGCFVWDGAMKYGLFFGGQAEVAGNISVVNYTWTFVHGQWTNITSTAGNAPMPLEYVRCAYDAESHSVILFGGHENNNANNFSNETWVFKSGKWKELHPKFSPVPSYGGEMFYDPQIHDVVLYGGRSGPPYQSEYSADCSPSFCPYLNATWLYSNGSWSQDNSSGVTPPGHLFGQVAWDNGCKCAVSFGGQFNWDKVYGDVPNLTYRFKGTWKNDTNPQDSPGGTFNAAFAYNSADNYILMFGGLNSTTVGTTKDPNTEWDYTWLYSGNVWTNATPPWIT